MKVLVIGSEGFIGSNLVRFFQKKGHVVCCCDIVGNSGHREVDYVVNDRSENFFTGLFGLQKPDVCINASGSGNVSYSLQHPVKDFEANCYDVIRILDATKNAAPETKYIHLSSAAVYGNPAKLPVNENDELKPLSPYGWHKLLSEHICREYSALYGSKIAIVRPFSVYGAGLRKQLLWDVCRKLDNADSISLFGTGKESRDFIHVDDLAHLIQRIINKGSFNCEVYNAACGKEVTVNEVAAAIAAEFDNKSVSFSGEEKPGDPLNWKADISKIVSIGFKPTINWSDGLVDYVRWYRNINNAQ